MNFLSELNASELIELITLVALSFLVVFALLLFFQSRSQRNLDRERQSFKMELEVMRRSFEDKLYQINERMLQTSNRWNDVNHLLVEASSTKEESLTTGYEFSLRSDFFRNLGVDETVTTNPKKVFVLTPFHERFRSDYKTISEELGSLGFEVSKGDEVFLEGNILRHIVTEIAEASFVIANIDGRNPNVFYELGIAHAMGKRVLILSSDLDEIPFDLRNHLVIFWRSKSELRDHLIRQVARLGFATNVLKQHP